MVPTLYFGRVTGVGLVMHQRAPNEPTNVGVIGLGVGTLAGYAREGDRFKFYEIDEDVVQIARDTRYFSYLSEAAVESEIVVGDGRLSLETELREGKAQAFDILVIDAFSSDAIPVHLLTKEAFEIYRQHLAPDGVILVQASNWHLDLAPIVFGLAHQQGMAALRITNREQPRYRSLRSMWVLVGRDSSVLDGFLAFLKTQLKELEVNPAIWSIQRSDRRDPEKFAYWTDDYSNVIRALRFGPMRRN
jgi:spermidine synthase